MILEYSCCYDQLSDRTIGWVVAGRVGMKYRIVISEREADNICRPQAKD